MAISLELFKHIARIDYDEDDLELQLYLDSATEVIERYTNVSLHQHTESYVSDGYGRRVYKYPIINVTGGQLSCVSSLHSTIIGHRGDMVTIEYGASDSRILEYAVYDLALTMYEEKTISPVKLPLDIQAKINQFRRDDFLS